MANYAAAVCTTYDDDIYADWYLPAICEIGHDTYTNRPSCAETPNVIDHLGGLLIGNTTNPDTSCSYGTNCLTGSYWSSTEYSQLGGSHVGAWNQYFASASSGSSRQRSSVKYFKYGVRCSRVLIP
jgi:hypothetical protein